MTHRFIDETTTVSCRSLPSLLTLPVVMLSVDTEGCHPCYFTTHPPAHIYWTGDTSCCSPTLSPSESEPAADPSNPLLAYRAPLHLPSIPSVPSSAGSLMQTQTSAAHGSATSRPRPVPVQNVLHVTSDDSSSSNSTSSASSYTSGLMSPLELARCSRCHRTSSIDAKTGKSNMVQYGLNLWYCNRCARMVGLIDR
ncbi:hypothetical protein M433DRAFT_360068 [Acidomyces richmondensis BFW]|nr:MAG: hypothetical protein FE78DRAFT_82747 [Acidomyces sp. 'richmondensis']KYG43352.1 hypothetical protein M433DRAFT_360068 [Acidomyces richmondensis BFW]